LQRKLAAVLAADVVGYSRLIAEDEARTLDALRALRRESFEPLVAEHRGEVVKRMGDGWLVSFASVVDAAQCAIQVQERLAGHDRIKLRIGVHLGDIVHEDEDIYGDGVNIASRLQEVAEPGGVLLSGTAYESVIGRLDAVFENVGTQNLKNITRDVTAWVWTGQPVSFVSSGPAVSPKKLSPEQSSIVVKQLTCSDGDTESRGLADGIGDDLATALAKIDGLTVLSAESLDGGTAALAVEGAVRRSCAG
jgi:adenylate cyclase